VRNSLPARIAASLVTVAIISLAVPSVASAADHSTKSASAPLCPGTARALETAIVRAAPSTDAEVVAIVPKDSVVGCEGLALGGRYDVCGLTNSNGWLIVFADNWYGYSAASCFG
jgi:hypothetical protein